MNKNKLLYFNYEDSELVIGIVSAVGTNSKLVTDYLGHKLEHYNYDVQMISVSKDVIGALIPPCPSNSEIERINLFMDLGNELRKKAVEIEDSTLPKDVDNSILALGVASEINRLREMDELGNPKPQKKKAYIVNSLKHPDEVERMREIYMEGFYLIGIAEDESRRIKQLTSDGRSNDIEAKKLIERDRDETEGHGQHTRDTFQLADFFISLDHNIDKTHADIRRILGLIFGNPYLTPTFDEYAMFMAFSTALRSADLSRQVGAIVARNNEILASGANDCPKAKGGLYWPEYQPDGEIRDFPNGRDYTRGFDSNKKEQSKIIQDILDSMPIDVDKESIRSVLISSNLSDITEYGRIVHAEMEALMSCARNNISSRGADLYCTTFPCHNCAKHIIASGIERVIYIEPYPKSKAFDFYSDAISSSVEHEHLVRFLPFVGVGPRRYFDLFSINLSSGYRIKRKNKAGEIVGFTPEKSKARVQMVPYSYLERESYATHLLKIFVEKVNPIEEA